MPKQRLDQRLVKDELCESREQAQRLIRAGLVIVNGHPSEKPGHAVLDDARVELKERPRFVSRGGDKLKAALDHFSLPVHGQICLDIGASTGGFTDCLLQHGAAKVYAVDVGRGQLRESLRQDDRVDARDRVNARSLQPSDFNPSPSLCVIDVSFISLTKILPAVTEVMASPADLVTLIKPQFEAGRDQVEKGGVVRNPTIHQTVLDTIQSFGTTACRLKWKGVIPSPLKGPAGNIEFLAHWTLA